MELPTDITAAVEKLCQNPDFLGNIAAFTSSAFCALLNLPEEEESSCPATFLFAINHLLTNNLKYELLLPYMPTEVHKDFMKVCSYYQKIVRRELCRSMGRRYSTKCLQLYCGP